MARYELSLSPTYVKHWTYVEAVREIFQNSIDQETINPNNLMAYSHKNDILKIYSLRSELDKSSLLMGNTTKGDNKNLIGSYGEGYKLALLVLARDGYKVSINNYAKKEVWTPKIIKSRRYLSDILVIDVDKWIFKEVPDNDLTFVIHGIDEEKFNSIKKSILFLQENVERIQTDRGDILLDTEQQGKIYVNGLYVEKLKGNILFGYDMKSEAISLDRDRKAVNTFELSWDTSYMWSKVAKTHEKLFIDLLDADSMDIQYINDAAATGFDDVYDISYRDFRKTHGHNAIPVSYESDKSLKEKYPTAKFVITSPAATKLINGSAKYQKDLDTYETITKRTPYEILVSYLGKHRSVLEGESIIEFEDIIEQSKEWRS